MGRSFEAFPTIFNRVLRAKTAAGALLVLATACSGDKSKLATRDSALDRDLTLAGSATTTVPAVVPMGDTAASAPRETAPKGESTVKPKPQSPPAPAPKPQRAPSRPVNEPTPSPQTANAPIAPPAATPVPAPAEPTPAPGPTMKTIPGGTALFAQTTSQLCSLANRPGDKIVANLTREVVGPDGAMLPAGTPVLIEMAAAEPPADFAFRVRGVQVNGKLIPVEGQVASQGETTNRRVSKGGDKGKVATGAVIGAILGRVIGGGTKGTVIGAAGGAAAGSVMAARNSVVEHCLPSGTSITVTLTGPLAYPATTQ